MPRNTSFKTRTDWVPAVNARQGRHCSLKLEYWVDDEEFRRYNLKDCFSLYNLSLNATSKKQALFVKVANSAFRHEDLVVEEDSGEALRLGLDQLAIEGTDVDEGLDSNLGYNDFDSLSILWTISLGGSIPRPKLHLNLALIVNWF